MSRHDLLQCTSEVLSRLFLPQVHIHKLHCQGIHWSWVVAVIHPCPLFVWDAWQYSGWFPLDSHKLSPHFWGSGCTDCHFSTAHHHGPPAGKPVRAAHHPMSPTLCRNYSWSSFEGSQRPANVWMCSSWRPDPLLTLESMAQAALQESDLLLALQAS